MATQQVLLSPAELDYLHTSLSLQPPIRPDGRAATQFRPLTAETGILQGTNGSASVTFSDGTSAIVGIKAEIEKTLQSGGGGEGEEEKEEAGADSLDDKRSKKKARGDWVDITVEIPSQRDDDAGTVFLGEMLREALLGDGEFTKKLWINSRFHWRLYIDVGFSAALPIWSLEYWLTSLTTDSPSLSASIIPSPTPLTHNTPRPPGIETTTTEIRRRRRPHV